MKFLHKQIVAIICGLAAVCGAQAVNWVDLTAANFPDSNFRVKLEKDYKNNTKAFRTVNNVKQIEADYISELSLTGAVNKDIKDVTGIKLFRNLKKILLPNLSSIASKDNYLLTSLDVSGMPYLETIDNGGYTQHHWNPAVGGGSTSVKVGKMTGNNVKLQSIIAEDCPKLTYVAVQGFSNLATLSLKGSVNMASLFASYTGIKSLDVSDLPKLYNDKSNKSPFANQKVGSFSLVGCHSLTEINLGSHPDIQYLDLSYCDALPMVDISGMTGAKCVKIQLATGLSGRGAMKEIVFGSLPALENFELSYGSMRKIDVSGIPNVQYASVHGNYLNEFDIAALPKLMGVDVAENCIYRLDLPKLKGVTTFEIYGNRMTFLPYTGAYTAINRASNGRHSDQTRNVGSVMKYKVFDDPDYAQYVMMTDDTSTYKNYKAPEGGHIGDPAAGEDPCYFYFDNDFHEGVYYLDSPAKKSAVYCQHIKVTLSRSEPDEFDVVEAHEFYLSGDFNNWQPDENHKFVLTDAANGIYTLKLKSDLQGDFRVWDNMTPTDVKLNFGGVDADLDDLDGFTAQDKADLQDHKGHSGHVYVKADKYYSLGEDPEKHYTTYICQDHGSLRKHVTPEIEMKYLPGDTGNYLTLFTSQTTGVDNVAADHDADGEVEYFNLQGIKVAEPAGGIFLRRCGNTVEKVVIP